MNLLNRSSMNATLDAVSECLYFNIPIAAMERLVVAQWLAARQGLSGAYAGTFAPAEQDAHGMTLFTGEPIRTRAATAHILGEECCRILSLLKLKEPSIQEALKRALCGLGARIDDSEKRGYRAGFYCCGPCSAAYWRNLANGLLPRAEERLSLGLTELKRLRMSTGRWRRFPFFYTCLVLTEIGPVLARDEMQHASAYWERNLNRLSAAPDSRSQRRAAVGRRLLELCGA
jgi:hypothetical protein